MTRDEEIVAAARAGKTGRQLAAQYGVSPSTISNIMRRAGHKPPTGRRPSKELDHDAFEVLTDDACYWMGFFCSDGSLADNGDGAPQIVFTLATSDRPHLEKFRAFLKSTHGITDSINKTSYGYHDGLGGKASHFRVRSHKLVGALRRHGLGGKSPVRFPGPALEMSPHFWRGAIDGDGSVRWTEDSKGYVYAQLILNGHMPVLEKYQRFLGANGVEANITNVSTIHQIKMDGSKAVHMIRLLYSDAQSYLTRKNETAQEIISKNGKR